MSLVAKRSLLEKSLAEIHSWFGREKSSLSLKEAYASGMFSSGNILYRFLFTDRVPSIRVDRQNFAEIQEKATAGTIIYYTMNLGQIEFGVFNQTCNTYRLPMSQWNNHVKTFRWLPFSVSKPLLKLRRQLSRETGELPPPLQNGLLPEMVKNRDPFLISLEPGEPATLSGHNRELLEALLQAAHGATHPVWLVPVQLIWDKRPQREEPSFLDILFGVTENPGPFRKIILYFRHYRKRCVIRFGEPIAVAESVADLYNSMLQSLVLEKRALTGPPIRPRSWFLDRIFGDAHLTSVLYEMAKEKAKPLTSVKRLALRYAKEIAADVRHGYLDFGLRCLNWFFKNFYGEIHIDEESIQRLKKYIAKGPVVLAPNHRSHVDYLLIAHLCNQYDIVAPHVAGGINLSFWPLGFYFRRCGTFFMRRSFAGNRLYKEVFQTYLKALIQEGYPHEFFIEGGRSRTGKLRTPKMGMLSMMTQVMLDGAAPDLTFVPICITYERVLEQKSYMKEIEGDAKQNEKTRDLLQLRKVFGKRRRHGQVYVKFDEPVSWQEVFQEAKGNKRELVRKLADRITHSINRQAVVTPMALTASAILARTQNGLSISTIESDFSTLYDYLFWKEVHLSDPLKADSRACMRESIWKLKGDRFIYLHEGLKETFYEIPIASRKYLDLYKNTIIHYLISLSLWCNLLLQSPGGTVESLKEDYAFLQQLFYFEFRFSTRRPLNEHLEKLNAFLIERGLEKDVSKLRFFAGLIGNFFESYQIALETCQILPPDKTPEKKLTKAMHEHGKHQLLLGNIRHPEAISQSNFENALLAFQELNFKENTEKIAACLKRLRSC